jgi:hypothetical protein
VPVHHQKEKMVACALATTFGSFKEGFDLSWIKEVLPSMWISNATFHITRHGKLTHWLGFLRLR